MASPSICENRAELVEKFNYSLVSKEYSQLIHSNLCCTRLQNSDLVLPPKLHGLGQVTTPAILPNLFQFGFDFAFRLEAFQVGNWVS